MRTVTTEVTVSASLFLQWDVVSMRGAIRLTVEELSENQEEHVEHQKYLSRRLNKCGKKNDHRVLVESPERC